MRLSCIHVFRIIRSRIIKCWTNENSTVPADVIAYLHPRPSTSSVMARDTFHERLFVFQIRCEIYLSVTPLYKMLHMSRQHSCRVTYKIEFNSDHFSRTFQGAEKTCRIYFNYHRKKSFVKWAPSLVPCILGTVSWGVNSLSRTRLF